MINNRSTLQRWLNRVKKPRRCLFYVCTDYQKNTAKAAEEHANLFEASFKCLPYETLFDLSKFIPATYIFTDFDRLSPFELTAAARLYRDLEKGGARVLNDPAKALNRDELLLTLRAAGINSFTCFRPAAGEKPSVFPVFLRTITGHRGTLSDLLENEKDCENALAEAVKQGYPLRDLIFIEYAAEPVAETGNFQKHAAYFFDGTVVAANIVNNTSWMAKTGVNNLATKAQYAEEKKNLDNYPYADWVKRVFDCAELDYGRVDFGILKGKPQVYEINTNPTLPTGIQHVNQDRAYTMREIQTRIMHALDDLAIEPAKDPLEIPKVYKRKGFSIITKRI